MKKDGATLIEVIVAVAIIIIVSVPISTIFLHSSDTTAKSAQIGVVSQIAQDKMEDIKNNLQNNNSQWGNAHPQNTQWSDQSSDGKYSIVCKYNLKSSVGNLDETGNNETYNDNLSSTASGTPVFLNDIQHPLDVSSLPELNQTVTMYVYKDSNISPHVILFDSNGEYINLNTNLALNSENVLYLRQSTPKSLKINFLSYEPSTTVNTIINCIILNDSNYNINASVYSGSIYPLTVKQENINNADAYNADHDTTNSNKINNYQTKNYDIIIQVYKSTDTTHSNCLLQLNSRCIVRG